MAVRIQKTREEEERVGRVVGQAGEVIRSFDDLQMPGEERQVTYTERKYRSSSAALNEANEFGENLKTEIRDMLRGIEEKLAEIGYQVESTQRFRGLEKFYSFFGARDRAERLRLKRIEALNVDESVREIMSEANKVVREIGTNEDILESNIQRFNQELNRVTDRIAKYQPLLLVASTEHDKLEAEMKKLELDLQACDEKTRPAAQKKFEEVQRACQRARGDVVDYLGVVNENQRNIDVLQKKRNADLQTVFALRQMQRGLFEKMSGMKPVFETIADTAKVRARVERFLNIDPAVNKVINLALEDSLKTAEATVDVAIDRARKAPIDPRQSDALAKGLVDLVERWAAGVEKLREEIRTGHPVDAEDGNAANDQVANAGNDNPETAGAEDNDIGQLKI